MRIWIDADACPAACRDIIFRAAIKHRIPTTLVADRLQPTPKAAWITAIQVKRGMDAADAHIVATCAPGDLVITHDIPLAAEIVAKGVSCLGIRGETFDAASIGERLSLRDFYTDARAAGLTTSGPPPYDDRAKAAFANAFDRWLTAARKGG